MPFLVEQQEGCFVVKYKLDDYYNSNIKPFLQATAATGLLDKCSLMATPNETYYLFSFRANTLCTLREWLVASTNVDDNDNLTSHDNESDGDPSNDEDDEEDMQNMHKNNSDNSDNSEDSDLFSNEHVKKRSYQNKEARPRKTVQKPDCELLMQVISYKEAILLIHSLSAQLNALRKRKITFYTFDLDSIFVINGNIFAILNPDLVMPINNSGLLTFVSPINKNNAFHCPEIANFNALPFNCHCNSVYYSFAALIIYCLFNTHLPRRTNGNAGDKREDDKLREDRELILSKLYGTKLYWFLLRCLEDISTNRQLLFI
jgi:hypothetical protein